MRVLSARLPRTRADAARKCGYPMHARMPCAPVFQTSVKIPAESRSRFMINLLYAERLM